MPRARDRDRDAIVADLHGCSLRLG
jgi:hypothetical protein